ncbi:hypothetical protein [Streptomyces luteogriseus]|uniref:hypothetical protein n=1 Tax=Streptomyces luteogriseus TaxID=68233 RepID=UPI0026160B5C|nr:hypothetical protein [Streptomyces luteogriseus]WTJ28064.1 hypothetical protein OID52_13795 [Streptomyces luteogriseus]
MIREHYILDSDTLLALGGHRQVSGLVHAAQLEPGVFLHTPVLSVIEAERERAGIAMHVGQLGIATVDLDYPAALSCCQLHSEGVPFGTAAAIEAAHRVGEEYEAPFVATVRPELYEKRFTRVVDLNR